MSDSNLELPPLGGDVEALLRIERKRPAVCAARAERMWAAISIELGATAVAGVAEASTVGGAASPVPSTVVSGIGKLVLLKALPLVAVGLAVGSVGGFVAGHRVAALRASHSRVLNQREKPKASPAPVPLLAPQLVPLPVPLASPVEAAGPATVPTGLTMSGVLPPAMPRVRHKLTARSDDDLAEEEAVLHEAESDLRAGDWSATLAELDAYARRYPKGELAEEAAYLGVRACQRGGDAAGTQTRLLDFRRRFPSSPLGKSTGD